MLSSPPQNLQEGSNYSYVPNKRMVLLFVLIEILSTTLLLGTPHLLIFQILKKSLKAKNKPKKSPTRLLGPPRLLN